MRQMNLLLFLVASARVYFDIFTDENNHNGDNNNKPIKFLMKMKTNDLEFCFV